jgi:hypothetical protein
MEPRLSGGLFATAVIAVLWGSLDALAYEQTTHAAMTREAMMQSQLNPVTQDLLERLGISDRQVSLRASYLDLADSGVIVRRSNAPTGNLDPPNFGRIKIDDANRQIPFKPEIDSLPGWLMLGAIREDDVKFDSGALENNPQDEPGGPTNRVLNHFYDPYNDRPLQFVTPLGKRTPDWALTDTGNEPEDEPGNHFSVLRAREAMWRALTLRSSPTQGMADLAFTADAQIPTKEALRTAYWATTFRALGDVVHLLQDMAQPQHTRNDPHSGEFCGAWACTGGHASFYEKYVDANVIGNASFTLRERTAWESLQGTSGKIPDNKATVLAGRVIYGGYPIPRFSDFRSYFVSATRAASTTGYGLANYSNQGFYSAGTNLGSAAVADFPSPPPTGAGLSDATMGDGTVSDTAGIAVGGTLGFKIGNVVDAANPIYTATAVRLSSYGLFDQFLKRLNKSQYTLNHYNYDDQMQLLIPRAVAYSAGLLDFFFRGRMEITLPDEGVYSIVDHAQFSPPNAPTDVLTGFKGFKQIRLRLSNSTPAIITTPDLTTVPQPMTSGTLIAVLKFHRNACYSDRLDGEITDPQQLPLCRTNEEEIVVSDPVKLPDQGTVPMSDASPGSAEFTFKFSNNALPINAWDVVLQVVYRGQLGSEADAVVVATKDISEPTFITTFNDTDRVLVGNACYDPQTVAASDSLWSQLSPSCKPTSGGLRQVTDICVNVPLNIRFSIGSAGKVVTVAMSSSEGQDRRLPSRRFGRFAVLTDRDGATTMLLGLSNVSYASYLAQQQDQVSFAGSGYQVVRSTVADTYVKHRGMKVWQGQYFVVDGTTATVSGTCPDAQFDPLQGPERNPQQSTITGWDDL